MWNREEEEEEEELQVEQQQITSAVAAQMCDRCGSAPRLT